MRSMASELSNTGRQVETVVTQRETYPGLAFEEPVVDHGLIHGNGAGAYYCLGSCDETRARLGQIRRACDIFQLGVDDADRAEPSVSNVCNAQCVCQCISLVDGRLVEPEVECFFQQLFRD